MCALPIQNVFIGNWTLSYSGLLLIFCLRISLQFRLLHRWRNTHPPLQVLQTKSMDHRFWEWDATNKKIVEDELNLRIICLETWAQRTFCKHCFDHSFPGQHHGPFFDVWKHCFDHLCPRQHYGPCSDMSRNIASTICEANITVAVREAPKWHLRGTNYAVQAIWYINQLALTLKKAIQSVFPCCQSRLSSSSGAMFFYSFFRFFRSSGSELDRFFFFPIAFFSYRFRVMCIEWVTWLYHFSPFNVFK